jgi:hypothetical protein
MSHELSLLLNSQFAVHNHCSIQRCITFSVDKNSSNPLTTEFLKNFIQECSPYLIGNTLRLRYKAQPINAVWGNSRCLLWEPYGTHRYTVWAECRVLNNIYKSSPYLTGNTLRHQYKAQPVNAVRGNTRCLLWEPYETHRCTLWAECGVLNIRNIYKSSPYLTGNTLRLRYKAQPVNAVWGNSHCFLWEPHGTHKYTVWAECRVLDSRPPLTEEEAHCLIA